MLTWTVRATCVRLSRQIGLRGPSDSHGPRLHDFRHRFAVQTLVRWYQEDVDVERHLPELSTSLGHVKVSDTYWYLSATPSCSAGPHSAWSRRTGGSRHDHDHRLGDLVETFCTDRLLRQKRASPHTIASYRDTFSLRLRCTQQRLGKAPSALALDDLDAPLIGAFLDDLEHTRARVPAAAMSASRRCMPFSTMQRSGADHSGLIQRVLATPSKRYDRTPMAFLTDVEIEARLAACSTESP